MENRREEFLKTVCQIYMAAVLVVLPLYYIPEMDMTNWAIANIIYIAISL